MLTILIRHKSGEFIGNETVIQASRVDMNNANELSCIRDDGSESVFCFGDGTEPYRDIFVMNEAGQTVARYQV